MKNKIKILIIDDEPQIRKLLKISLEVNDFDCVEAETGIQGLQLAASINPDVILLDLNLPDSDGLSILKKLREWSSSQIIILSVRSSENDKIALLDAGADDYITKPFHTGELIARINVAMRHKDTINELPIINIGDIEINLASRTVKKANAVINLTSTEFALLKLLAQNKDRAMTHKQILETIWGNSFSEETQYLRVFVGQLRKKIEDDFAKPKYIKTISGVGYILSTE